MKKYRIKNRVRFTAFMAAFVLITIVSVSSMLGFNEATGMDVPQYTTVSVQSGDTLWELARRYGPADADVRMVVYQIGKINNINA